MFITDYHTLVHNRLPAEERLRLSKLQGRFSLIKVKVLLLSLLDGFRVRTLTLTLTLTLTRVRVRTRA